MEIEHVEKSRRRRMRILLRRLFFDPRSQSPR